MDISQDSQVLLKEIATLSQEFGTSDFVRGGGGNTSVKNKSTVWVKPSGTTLLGMTTDTFVALDRKKYLNFTKFSPLLSLHNERHWSKMLWQMRSYRIIRQGRQWKHLCMILSILPLSFILIRP